MKPGSPRPVRFDDAFEQAKAFVRRTLPESGVKVVVLRDLYGCITIIIDGERGPQHDALANEIHAALGEYSPGVDAVIQFRDDLIAPDAIFKATEARPLFEDRDDVLLLERQVIEQDWLGKPLRQESAKGPKRAAFFGIKGGVGRSTALAVLAWRLAQSDKRVLVVDLDLESPGLSSTLLPDAAMPDYGIVDWLVEDAIGQADDALLADMVQSSPLVKDTGGEIRVVPSGGKKGDYIAKLSRAYMGGGGEKYRDFAERLDGMIGELEQREKPDIVLLDSRAGLHDDAAAVVTRLGAMAFLFAVGTAQTWHAYEVLFKYWHNNPAIRGIRQNLKMVSSMIPPKNRDEYEKDFREASYGLFQRHMYDTPLPGRPDLDLDVETIQELTHQILQQIEPTPFNYDVKQEEAPHFPLGIYWNEALSTFDPVLHPRAVPEDQIELAFGGFVRGVADLLGIELRK
jgi:CobQ/CobB/MinD/ParA nucleotide binding domain